MGLVRRMASGLADEADFLGRNVPWLPPAIVLPVVATCLAHAGCLAGNRVGTAAAQGVGAHADGPVAEQRTNVAGAQANVEAELRATVESLGKLTASLQTNLAAVHTGDVSLGATTTTGDGNVSVDCGGGLPRWLYGLILAAGAFYPAVIRPIRLRFFGPEREQAKTHGVLS